MPVHARRWRFALLALALFPGCFLRAQGGYQTSALGTDRGGGQVEFSVGKSDFRAHGKPLKPMQYGADLVMHAGDSGERVGFGLSALWAPMSGWLYDFSPTLRLGGRPLQLVWSPVLAPSVSVFGELGLAWFPDRHPTSRAIYSVSLGAEFFGNVGIRTPFLHRVYVVIGVTFETPLAARM